MSLVPHDDNHHEPKTKTKQDEPHVLQHRRGRTLQPLDPHLKAQTNSHTTAIPTAPQHPTPSTKDNGANPAIDLIRRKLNELYTDEPAAAQETVKAEAQPAAVRSKHQQFMHNLSSSGKSLAEIQTAWHHYYNQLPEFEKHEVWQEFYANNKQASAFGQPVTQQPSQPAVPADLSAKSPFYKESAQGAVVADHTPTPEEAATSDRRTVADIKQQLLKKVGSRSQGQLKAKHHLQSLAFGLGTGALVLLIFLFGFFNEIVIAPFIQPSRHAGATPIILNTDGVAPSDTPEVIIPKINVQIPVDYTQTSIDETATNAALDSGILHYPTTAKPGQQGNGAFFGHSSNNIFNKGKYKFAFVSLNKLVPGDIFYITYNKQVYSYKVYEKKIVSPQQVEVLNNVPGKVATAALITCDPPGTAINRLVVWGEQISPDPGGNSAAPVDATTTSNAPAQLADNGPTLWKRLTDWAGGLFSN